MKSTMIRAGLAGLLLCGGLGCDRAPAGGPAEPSPPRAKTQTTAAKAPAAASVTCGSFGPSERLGKLSKRIKEASGLVLSARDPSVLWVHNDGAEGILYGVSVAKGKVTAEVTLSKLQPSATDWEALTAGPCGAKLGAPSASANTNPGRGKTSGQRCLIIGDIGDNEGARASVAFHRLAEPDPRGGAQQIGAHETLIARYPKGKHYNSEAFVMDAAGTIWLWTKGDKHTRLFKVPFHPGTATFTEVAKIKAAKAMGIKAGRDARITAASWDPSTHRLLLRSYGAAWELCLGEAGLEAMPSARWQRVDVADEKQGETIAVSPDGFYHVSEGKRPRMYHVRRK